MRVVVCRRWVEGEDGAALASTLPRGVITSSVLPPSTCHSQFRLSLLLQRITLTIRFSVRLLIQLTNSDINALYYMNEHENILDMKYEILFF